MSYSVNMSSINKHMKPIIVYDSISKKYQDDLEKMFVSRDFPWYAVHEQYSNGEKTLGFSHLAINDGPDNDKGSTASIYFSMLLPIIYTMGEILGKEIDKILRARVGLLVPSNTYKDALNENYVCTEGGDDPHVDFFIPHYTGLYYINDSDGDTLIYNEKEQKSKFTLLDSVSPEKGKICIFDGEHYHASTKPTKSYCRLVLTCNFTTK